MIDVYDHNMVGLIIGTPVLVMVEAMVSGRQKKIRRLSKRWQKILDDACRTCMAEWCRYNSPYSSPKTPSLYRRNLAASLDALTVEARRHYNVEIRSC